MNAIIHVNDKDNLMAGIEQTKDKGKGYTFNMDIAAYTDEGKLKNVYLNGEFDGFAVHIM